MIDPYLSMPVIAAWLKDIRRAQGLEQVQLAERSGVCAAQISRVESQLSGLTLPFLTRVFFGLGLTLKDLLHVLELEIDVSVRQEDCAKNFTVDDACLLVDRYRQQREDFQAQLIRAIVSVFSVEQDTALALVLGRLAAGPKGEVLDATVLNAGVDFDELLWSDDVWTMNDLGMYVWQNRRKLGTSLRKFSYQTAIPYHSLLRIERGVIELVKLSDVLAIQQKIPGCNVLWAAWKASELHTGILVSKSRGIEPVKPWADEEIQFVEAATLLYRWGHRFH